MRNANARFAATVDLPTPPLPLATAIVCFTPGRTILCALPPGGLDMLMNESSCLILRVLQQKIRTVSSAVQAAPV